RDPASHATEEPRAPLDFLRGAGVCALQFSKNALLFLLRFIHLAKQATAQGVSEASAVLLLPATEITHDTPCALPTALQLLLVLLRPPDVIRRDLAAAHDGLQFHRKVFTKVGAWAG